MPYPHNCAEKIRDKRSMDMPIIIADPLPRRLDTIMEPSVRRRLEALGKVVLSEDQPMADEEIDRLLPRTSLVLGQTALPRERLDRAPLLKAVINVETNFLPNIDYATCSERGIWVLAPGSAFAGPVAEATLGMALDLARGITAADRDFRAGREKYGLAGNAGTFRFEGASVGIIGFGDLGRSFRDLIRPFRNPVSVYDPWLPPEMILRHDCRPAGLDEILTENAFIVVFASVTSENQGFIGARQFGMMKPGTIFLLMSRAAVVDFPAMLEAGGGAIPSRRARWASRRASGRLRYLPV